MVLPGSAGEESVARVARLVAAMSSGSSGSAGVSDLRDADSVNALMRRADATLYQAKRNARNTVAAAAG